MTVKSKILATAATLALVGGVGTAGVLGSAVSANAATPSCGASCVNTYPAEYAGTSNDAPQFVLDVFQQHARIGQPIILFRASNADPAEDWVSPGQGTVAQFYAAGLISGALALHYGCTNGTGPGSFPVCTNAENDTAYELQYAPFGVDSGLCMGLAATAASGEDVTLQQCGSTAKVVWIEDTLASDESPVVLDGTEYWAGVNGSDTSFSNPEVLTYPANAYPTDKPRAELTVASLAQFSNGTPADDNTQLWTAFGGVLP